MLKTRHRRLHETWPQKTWVQVHERPLINPVASGPQPHRKTATLISTLQHYWGDRYLRSSVKGRLSHAPHSSHVLAWLFVSPTGRRLPRGRKPQGLGGRPSATDDRSIDARPALPKCLATAF